MKPAFFITVLISFLAGSSFAQPNMQRDSSIVVKIAGNTLRFPWAGGLNFTNWGMMDLDNDGFKDLVVYDKSGGKIRTFINDKQVGQASFSHNSVYQDHWPTLYSWFALYDFNCDGKEDIFTYANGAGGILVYKNISTPGNFQFAPVGKYDAGLNMSYLESDYTPVGVPGKYNIPVTQVALPGVSDLDNDGDLDILVFNAQGYQVEYHQNISKDLGYNCDSLIFQVIDNCWGDFQESTCSVTKNACPFPKIVDQINEELAKTEHHAGSCMMCFNADGDSLTDVLLGDVVCDSVIYLHNGGYANNAHIDANTVVYPPSRPVGMSIFPCTYYMDVNNDGKRDLIASPALQGSEDVNNQWLYTNSNTDNNPVLNYVQNNFLQESMIDLGEGAFPTLFDYEGDGDLDLLVGNFGYFGSPSYHGSIAFFKNIGSTTVPSFSLITTDFSNLSTLGSLNLAPTTGDLDGDGDPDLLLGNNAGQFYYFTNTGGVGNPAVFSSTPSASYGVGFLTGVKITGPKAYPQLIDLDRDGKLDIVAGGQNGKVFYFRNTGTTATPSFATTATSAALGGINVLQPACSSYGNAMPYVFDDGGSYKMLIGCECGNLYLYHNIDGNLSGNFTQINATAFGILEGEHSAPVVRDLNGDGRLDLLIGNYSGGLDFYRGLNSAYYSITENELRDKFELFPNPSSGEVRINFSDRDLSNKSVRIFDLAGEGIREFSISAKEVLLDVSNMTNGIYFVEIKFLDHSGNFKNGGTQKLVVQH